MKIRVLVALLLLIPALTLTAGGNSEVPTTEIATSGVQYISPNGDGVQDDASLSFSVTVYVKSDSGFVPEYALQIKDSSGSIVHEVKQTEESDIGFFARLFRGFEAFTLERTITWDGTDQNGTLLADGTYPVTLYVVDSSGNRGENAELDDFVIDTTAPTATIVTPDNLLLSPNGDGNLDSINLTITDASVEDLWTAQLLDESGTAVWSQTWENSAPESVTWYGHNAQGADVPAGTYSYVLSATDRAGNESGEITLEGIILDRTDTPITIELTPTQISPNADGVQDTVTISSEVTQTDGVLSWSGTITSEGGVDVVTMGGDGLPPESVVFAGFTEDGTRLPEGLYTISYSLTYQNGNRPVVSDLLRIDVTPPSVIVNVDSQIFSPDGDGQRDEVYISLDNALEQLTWEGNIQNSTGTIVLETSSNETTTLINWKGTDATGAVVPDGAYTVHTSFTDLAGNTQTGEVKTVIVDTRPVFVTVDIPKGFSPNGDGEDDTLLVTINSNLREGLKLWHLSFQSAAGSSVRSFSGEGVLPETLEWDGRSGTDAELPEGYYVADFLAIYDKGDRFEILQDGVFLDVTPPEVSLKVTAPPFSRTEEGIEGEAFITVDVKDDSDVRRWEMDILDEDGNIVRSYGGDGSPENNVSWNGRISDDPDAPEAISYTLVMRVIDNGGNEAVYEQDVDIEILIVRKDDNYYLAVPNIVFGAYKTALDSSSLPGIPERNGETVARVIRLHEKYPIYGLEIEGHALNIYKDDAAKYRDEEAVLLPLTEARAEAVRDALVAAGFPADMLSTVGYGSDFPIAPELDWFVHWKNRRVEFRIVVEE